MSEQDCKHPVQLFGMCAVCGQAVDADSDASASLSVMHSSASVKVSAEEAQRLDSESTSHLLSQRKLALIVDLDQTVIHATVDPTVGEWMRDESNPNYQALQSVGKFRLGIDGEEIKDDDDPTAPKDAAAALRASRACWYYVKPRPGVPEVLQHLAKKYQLHVYTMGTRSYANCVCKVIDPDASLFGNRILSRDENGSLVRKSLSRLFPVDHSMVVIIDDREDVWSRSPNLIPVEPYEFFIGIGDINATFLPTLPAQPAAPPAFAKASTSATKLYDAPAPSSSTATDAQDAATTGSTSGATNGTTPAVEDAVHKAQAEGRSDEELQAVREAAVQFAAQSEKLQSKLAAQRDARPLAKMQEALDEKLGKRSSRSGTATPNGTGDATPATLPTDPDRSIDKSSESSQAAEAATTTPPTSPPGSDEEKSAEGIARPALPPPPPPPPPQSHAVLVDRDTEMDRVRSILDELHAQWYARYDEMQAHPKPQAASDATVHKPSVVDLLAAKKKQVLHGCVIVFSSMIPIGTDHEKSDEWALAREFGATPAAEIEEGVTTHVIAGRLGTVKVQQALRIAEKQRERGQEQLHVVQPPWFHGSTIGWARREEDWYRVSSEDNAAFLNCLAQIRAAAPELEEKEPIVKGGLTQKKLDIVEQMKVFYHKIDNNLRPPWWDELEKREEEETRSMAQVKPSSSLEQTDTNVRGGMSREGADLVKEEGTLFEKPALPELEEKEPIVKGGLTQKKLDIVEQMKVFYHKIDNNLRPPWWDELEKREEEETRSMAQMKPSSSLEQTDTNVRGGMSREGADLVKEEGTLFESELNEMDWGAAADEVDAYLDSATTASNTSSPSPSMLAEGDLAEVEPLPASTLKRVRDEGDDEEEEEDEGQKKAKHETHEGDAEEDGIDSFLDDLAEELDGQLDDE